MRGSRLIYTTYFAQLRNLPSNIVPISICLYPPEWYNGLQYTLLAPTYEIFTQWRENHDENSYEDRFNAEVLSLLTVDKVLNDLDQLLPIEIQGQMKNIVHKNFSWNVSFVCYEPKGFCHRHLVSKWLCENGIYCKEYNTTNIRKLF